MDITDTQRAGHLEWLRQITRIPTAAGRERRVIGWVERWVADRPELSLTTDAAGNLTIARANEAAADRPVYFTAHLDHPAFVVERVIGPGAVQLAFRGGVMDDYFPEARVVIHTEDEKHLGATIGEKIDGPDAHFKRFMADLDDESDAVCPGDIATWELPEQEIIDGQLHTNVCDDLAALAAALSALDVLLHDAKPIGNVRVLLTRAEEVGFIGAIAACRNKTMPRGSRVIALENSRAFEDSPIGGGPIVRVGDRVSIFSPGLTAACATRAQDITGRPAIPVASQKESDLSARRWQRKLMAGGACEASVFCTYGYESTCLCLPLGNYHNMADLAAVQAGTNTTRPRVGREHIAIDDYEGLVDLLVACGRVLPEADSFAERVEKLWDDLSFVLDRADSA